MGVTGSWSRVRLLYLVALLSVYCSQTEALFLPNQVWLPFKSDSFLSSAATIFNIFPLRFAINVDIIAERLKGVNGYTLEEWHWLQSLRRERSVRRLRRQLRRRIHQVQKQRMDTRIRSLNQLIDVTRNTLNKHIQTH